MDNPSTEASLPTSQTSGSEQQSVTWRIQFTPRDAAQRLIHGEVEVLKVPCTSCPTLLPLAECLVNGQLEPRRCNECRNNPPKKQKKGPSRTSFDPQTWKIGDYEYDCRVAVRQPGSEDWLDLGVTTADMRMECKTCKSDKWKRINRFCWKGREQLHDSCNRHEQPPGKRVWCQQQLFTLLQ